MRIKSIVLYNVGPYVDKNKFDFTLENNKNIVLIGGKNGAGKTTFFKSIKTCLYGCRVWGFDAPGKEYFSIINSLVNINMLYNTSAKAFVEIELVFNNGKEINSYVLHREWAREKTSLSESFSIIKNGALLIGGEKDDFINYLLSVIPPDMFNFYFFDGESIAEFFLGADGNKNFRNAFLKLYGLDTLSIMVDNFNRNIKKQSSKDGMYEVFVQTRNEAEKQEKLLDKLNSEIKDLEDRLDLLGIKQNVLKSEYVKEGGIALSDWKNIQANILKEESERDNINRWLKDIANNYLPFVLLEKQLAQLMTELEQAQEHQKNALFLDKVSTSKFKETVNEYLSKADILGLPADELIDLIQHTFKYEIECEMFDFSINQIHRIIMQIQEKQSFDKQSIKKALANLRSSLRQSKKLRDSLQSSSIDGYEEYVEQKDAIEKQIDEVRVLLEAKKLEKERQQVQCNETMLAYIKAKEKYELVLKNKSINDLSSKAVAVYSLLEERLVDRQGKILQNEFLKCFTKIINKDNFVDGIVIDKNINIIPYKMITINKSQLSNYMMANNEFIKLFDYSKYIMKINNLEFGDVDSISVPSPIKPPFSQGERQVYIMSLYLALLNTSHKDIPFFIDTPFARIDSDHRSNIVDEFFLKIKNQLFVLSTDEEIVGEYKEMMDSKISNTYTLQINKYGKTEIIPDSYFGGQDGI